MASNSLAILRPEPDTDYGYWDCFIERTRDAVGRLFNRVDILQGTEDLDEQNVFDYDVILAVAPRQDAEVPSGLGKVAWIPRIGEAVGRTHPWAFADLILLPLGARVVDHDLPVTHLGYGVTLHPHAATHGAVLIHGEGKPQASDETVHSRSFREITSADGDETRAALQSSSVAIIWPCSCTSGLPLLFEACSRGVVSVIPDTDPVLSYFCQRTGAGIPCSTLREALRTAQHLLDQPEKLTMLRQAAYRSLRRDHSWSKVSRRLAAALDSFCHPMPDVHTVVLNWNGRELLPDCLESLRHQEYPRMVPVLVDNGSTDDSCSFVQTVFPECRVLRNPKNLGFALGNNRGMHHALESRAQYVALLNNDTRVCRGWIRELVNTAEQEPAVGAVGSRMLFYDSPRMINSAGGMMNQSFYGWDRGVFEHDDTTFGQRAYCFFVTGGSVLLRSEALKKVGLFDPAFFAYYEDNDLCHRLRQDGWRIVYQPRSKVFHKVSATSGPVSDWKTYLLERSRYRFMLKNVPLWYLSRYGAEILAQEWDEMRHWWRAREYRRFGIQLHAVLAALARLPDILVWRMVKASGRDTGWVHYLEPGFARPVFSAEREELDNVYRGLVPDGRTVVSCMPWSLGGAWSSVVKEFPRYRLLQGTGTVRFETVPVDKGYVQLHLLVPPETSTADLHIRILSCDVDQVVNLSRTGWHTALIEVEDVPANPTVTLSSSRIIGFNEVSLLPQDSVLVRRT